MWTQSPLTWPSSVQNIQTQVEQTTSQVGTAMNSGVNRLKSLEGDANYGRHPLSSQAEGLIGLRQELESLLVDGTILTVNPYQHQVGTHLLSGRYLNPQSASYLIAQKMRDQVDAHRPSSHQNGLVVMVTASQLGQFSSLLNHLVRVFPLPDWCQVARIVAALTTNETDKLFQPAAITQPRFKPQFKLDVNPIRSVLGLQGSQIAAVESLADDKTHVIGKLQQLAHKRAERFSQLSSSLNALKQMQGSVWSMKVSGTPQSISSQLLSAGVPNTHQFTVASMMLSDHPLTFFEQLLC